MRDGERGSGTGRHATPRRSHVRWQRSFAVALLLSCGAAGCVSRFSPDTPLLDRLEGRGPVALSHDNPYLPADRVFEQELAKSDVIRELITQQGKPTALSIERGFLSPTTMTFYYPGKEEFYTLKPAGEDWELQGPDSMYADEAQEMLSELGAAVPLGSAPSAQGSKTATLGRSKGSLSNLDTISARARMEPAMVGARGGASAKRPESAREGAKDHRIPTTAPIKKLPSGAIQHTVTFPRETLSVIAKWYTGSAKNAPALAKVNKIKSDHRVSVGEKVVIPKQLLKRTTPLTSAAVG